MSKYWSVFKISFQEEFAYRVNFIMWRLRNIFQIFLVFFLWDAVFSDPGRVVFGYTKSKILTYVLGLILVKALVLSARATNVAGEISRGDLSNYLVKPISYFKYWLTRDISSKALNFIFALFEIMLIYLILKPPFFIQTNLGFLFAFAITIALAIFIYFVVVFITSSIPFWMPEAAWGAHFLITVVIIEFLSGALFPLDILPEAIQKVLEYTPFPYLIFFPLQVYLGEVATPDIVKGIIVSFAWAVVLWFVMNSIWRKGLKVYESHGK